MIDSENERTGLGERQSAEWGGDRQTTRGPGRPCAQAHPQPPGHLQMDPLHPPHRHSLSATCVPGTALGSRDSGNKTRKNARLMNLAVDCGGRGRCARSVIPPPGYPRAHLPPMLVHGSSQGIAGATGEDAHRRLHSLFPVRAIQEPIQHLEGRKPDPWVLLLAPQSPQGSGPRPPVLPHTAAHRPRL